MTAQTLAVTAADPAADTALIWPRALPARLPRFVLLAVLLHVWLVLMLGNAPGGTAREGQGVFGSLNITLQGAPTGPAGAAAPPQLPATATGAWGEAEQQRFGGAVRSALPLDPAQPGAAQLGDWSPLPGSAPDGQPAAALREPAREPTPEPTPLPALAAPPALPAATAPSADGATAVLGLQRSLPSVLANPSINSAANNATNNTPLPRVAPAAVAALPPVPGPSSLQALVVTAPLKQVTSPPPSPLLQAAPQAPLRPTGTAVWAQNPVLTAVPLPSATLPAASAERQLTARLPPDRAAAGTALSDVGRASAGPLLGAVPALAPLAAAPLPPAAAPEPTTAQLPRVAPAAALSAPQPALAAPPAAAAAAPMPSLQNLARPGPALVGSSATDPLPAAAPPAGQGAPDAGSRVGTDVATLPSTPASAPKRLNLELPRLRGGELSRYSTTGLLPALPRPPEVPDKLGSAIEKTAKEDCRKAYAGAGLLAVVPLAVDALREGGCKW